MCLRVIIIYSGVDRKARENMYTWIVYNATRTNQKGSPWTHVSPHQDRLSFPYAPAHPMSSRRGGGQSMACWPWKDVACTWPGCSAENSTAAKATNVEKTSTLDIFGRGPTEEAESGAEDHCQKYGATISIGGTEHRVYTKRAEPPSRSGVQSIVSTLNERGSHRGGIVCTLNRSNSSMHCFLYMLSQSVHVINTGCTRGHPLHVVTNRTGESKDDLHSG